MNNISKKRGGEIFLDEDEIKKQLNDIKDGLGKMENELKKIVERQESGRDYSRSSSSFGIAVSSLLSLILSFYIYAVFTMTANFKIWILFGIGTVYGAVLIFFMIDAIRHKI